MIHLTVKPGRMVTQHHKELLQLAGASPRKGAPDRRIGAPGARLDRDRLSAQIGWFCASRCSEPALSHVPRQWGRNAIQAQAGVVDGPRLVPNLAAEDVAAPKPFLLRRCTRKHAKPKAVGISATLAAGWAFSLEPFHCSASVS